MRDRVKNSFVYGFSLTDPTENSYDTRLRHHLEFRDGANDRQTPTRRVPDVLGLAP